MLRLNALPISLACFCLPAGADAQTDYPIKPVRVVVTAPAGAASDTLARAVVERMSKSLAVPFVVENRPGAGGNVAGAYVAKQRPDGYTVLLASVSSHAINHSLYSKPPYHPLADFTSIVALASSPNVLIVDRNLSIRSTAELIDFGRKNPSKMSYSSGGSGTSQHLSAELFRSTAGLESLHVPFKGSPEAILAVARGDVTYMFANIPNAIELAKAGTVRLLGVTSKQRVAWLPDVPTLAEAGFPGFEATAWFGLVGPAGMPPGVVAKLNAEARKALDLPEVRQALVAQGFDVIGGSPLEFQRFISNEMVKWSKAVSLSGAKVN